MTVPQTIAAAAQALRAGAVTSVDLTRACLARIAAREGELHAFVTVTAERALADAARADAELRAGHNRGPLHGIPIALKDLIATAGIRTTAGSAVLRDHIPSDDADVARDLAGAGAVLVGKTNTHEFAWGVFTPPTRNPWDVARVPGGSSGGSAVAVATGEALAAIGTDTGGSIRIPAACCGVTGHKPTFGRVSLAGIIPLSASLDHAGPLARTAEDCALLLDAIAAPAWRGRHIEGIDAGIADVQMRWLSGPWEATVTPEVLAVVRAAGDIIAPDAAPLDALAPYDIAELFSDYRVIQSPEAVAYHRAQGWFPDHAADYTAITRDFLERGSDIPAYKYVAAQRRRQEVIAYWEAAIDAAGADIVLAPTLPIVAPTVAEAEDSATSQAAREALLRLTFPFDMLGVPVLSVPCGFVGGLPVAMQIIGRRDADALVLRIGHAFQQMTNWHMMSPPDRSAP